MRPGIATVHRLFETSTERRRVELGGRWEFITDPDDTGHEAGYPVDFPTEDAEDMYVPCVWNTTPEYYEYQGPAWYHRSFRVHESTSAKLTFLGVAQEASVYLDGERLGSHYGGYTPFSFYLPDLDAGGHELVLRVDNTPSETTLPKTKVDWAHYGGITREVVLEEVGDVLVDDIRVEYDIDGESATVEPTVDVYNFGASGEFDVDVYLDDTRRGTSSVTLDATDERATATTTFTLDDVELWSPDSPRLYDVRAEVAADDYCDRVGFRSVEVTPTDILVNGNPVGIAGVNRHEDHPEWGHGLPPRLMKRDVDVLQQAGLNAVRTSHYPNHPVFLDYCDREGLLVVEEIPYWQYDEDDFATEIVMERGKRMLAEMITRDYNHPSVLAWSLHNECETQQQGVYEATETLASVAREHDVSRPLTFATNNHYLGDEEICAELVDFLSINGYWGWYSDEKEWDEFLDGVRAEFPDMPIVVSEFGAGAVSGERNFDRRKWSENYQAHQLESAIETFENKEYVSGFFIWQYSDTNTAEALFTGRPKLMNNKGIVTAYRRPKDAYWAVQRLLDGT